MSALTLTLYAALAAASPANLPPADAMPMSVGSGVIHGGWGYVWTAYGIFWAGLAIYALSLFIRTRAAHVAANLKEQA